MLRLCASLVAAAVLWSGTSFAQSWVAQSGPADGEGPVTGIWGRGDDELWIVTGGGAILHSKDRGKSFMHLKLDAPRLSAVTGTGREVIILGPGTIYRSSGGSDWTAHRLVAAPDLRAAWASENGLIIVVGAGGKIFRSEDGGVGWREAPSGTTAGLNAVWGMGQHVVAVGEGGAILSSMDGGKTWSAQTSGSPLPLFGVWGLRANDVVAVGADGVVLRWDGQAWRKAAVPALDGATLAGVWGRGDDVFVVGSRGTILHGTAKGWSAEKSGTSAVLRVLWGTSGGDLLAGGDALIKRATAPPVEAPASWSVLEAGANAPLRDAWLAGDSLFLVGERGTILHSNDGGATFGAQASGTEATLRAVFAVGDDVWAVGDRGTVLHSGDEGQSWSGVSLGVSATLRCIWGSDRTDLWIVGDGGLVLRTTDGGHSWRSAASGTGADLHAVWGRGRNDVWIVGAGGTILHAVNGTVARAPKPPPGTPVLRSVWGTAREVYVVGDALLATNDGGKTWRTIDAGQPAGFVAERVRAGAGEVVIAGGSQHGAALVQSKEGGRRWGTSTVSGAKVVTGLAGSDKNVYAVAGQVVLMQGPKPTPGVRWSRVSVAPGVALNRMWSSSPEDVYVVGEKGLIARSTDRGRTWARLSSGVTEPLYGVWGSGPNDVWAVGKGGVIVRSADQGQTWTRLSTGTKDDLNAVWGSGAADVYVVGAQGEKLGGIFRTTDGGKTWIAQMGGGRTFRDVWGSGAADIYAVAWDGADGVVVHSTNQGRSWGTVKTGEKNFPYLTWIWGSSASDLWVLGFGVVLRSRDGGATWKADEKTTGAGAAGFGGVWGSGPGDVYMTADGFVFHSTDGGKTWREMRPPIGRTGAIWGFGPGELVVLGDGEVAVSAVPR